MRFRIPGRDQYVRFMEPVVTADDQYHIYDTGVEYGDGTIDSIAVGGSFATLKRLASEADDKSLKTRTEDADVPTEVAA